MGSLGNFNSKTPAYFLTVAALLSAILSYMSTVSMRFTDGYLAEFEQAAKPLLIIYTSTALFFGILFYGLARFSSKSYSRVVFYSSLVLFVIVALGLAVLYFYYGSHLNHGGGG